MRKLDTLHPFQRTPSMLVSYKEAVLQVPSAHFWSSLYTFFEHFKALTWGPRFSWRRSSIYLPSVWLWLIPTIFPYFWRSTLQSNNYAEPLSIYTRDSAQPNASFSNDGTVCHLFVHNAVENEKCWNEGTRWDYANQMYRPRIDNGVGNVCWSTWRCVWNWWLLGRGAEV